jgi:allophanate hydrolase subunit 2
MAIAGAQFEVTCDDRPVGLGASFAVHAGSA